MNVEVRVGQQRGEIVQYSWLPPDVQQKLQKACAAVEVGATYIALATTAGDGKTRWDGVHRLLTAQGRFPAGLAKRIVRILQEEGCFVTLRDESPTWTPREIPASNTFVLEPEQYAAVSAVLRNKDHRMGIISAPPRSGKTLIAADAIRLLGGFPALFLLERLDIAQPPRGAVQKFRDFFEGTGLKIGWAYDGQVEMGDVMVVTIQTAAQVIGFERKAEDDDIPEISISEVDRAQVMRVLETAKIVVIDEAHHCSASSYRAVLKACVGRGATIGLSGTPWRDDNMDLVMEGAVGPVVHEITYKSMIERGRLVPTHVYICPLPEKSYSSSTSFAARRKDYIHENPIRNMCILEFVREMQRLRKSTMVIVDHVSQLTIIHNHLKRESIPHTCMSASGKWKVEPRDRMGVWERCQSGEITCLVTTLGQEGLDWPCHPGSTLILTKDGYKRVDAIEPGQIVVDHRGHEQTVEAVESHVADRYLQIKRTCYNEPLEVTENHILLVGRPVREHRHHRRLRFDELDIQWSWREAKDAKERDFLLSPIVEEMPSKIDLLSLIPDHQDARYGVRSDEFWVWNPHQNSTSRTIRYPRYISNDDPLLAALLGLYLADGSLSGTGQVTITTNEKKTWDLAILQQIRDRYGLQITTKMVTEKHTKRSNIYSWYLTLLARVLIGQGAINKRIPLWVLQGSRDFREAFMLGMQHGDGHVGKQMTSYTSASAAVAYGYRDLLLTLDVHSSVFIHSSELRGITKHRAYTVCINGNNRKEMHQLLEAPFESVDVLRHHVWDNGSATRIVDIKEVAEPTTVYSLKVSGEASYVTAVAAVHNCLDAVVVAGGGASSVRASQRMRCMTAYPGKTAALVLDFQDRAKYFSSHSNARLQQYTRHPRGVMYVNWIRQFDATCQESISSWLKSKKTWREMFEGRDGTDA